ncbi:hypothetical protein MKK65_08235 [Methylobacterium sp. J-001]|nr:hypothetical protein [Methylobacterium sp. J-001]MCJ2116567.1 hypothetical protein [Methylobacterium sp. J-001]
MLWRVETDQHSYQQTVGHRQHAVTIRAAGVDRDGLENDQGLDVVPACQR